tara:strand:- start:27 stop:1094 length:1068 start_codon:yes stop_codon:yes gene_type:complete
MTPKSVLVLAAATVLSVAAAVVSLKVNQGYATSAGDGLLFPGLLDKVDRVTKVTVNDKDQKIVMIRTEAGSWQVPASDGYSASIPQVQKSILQVAQLVYFEKKTANVKRYERLHLEDIERADSEARRIRLFQSDGAVLADLIVGKKRYNLPGTIPEGAYIRKPGDPQTWLASGEIDVEVKLKTWLRNSILNIREEDVLSAEIRHPGGEVVRISKENTKDRNFSLHDIPEGKKLRYESDPDNIANVVEDLEMLDARRADKIDFAADKTVTGTYISRSGLIAVVSAVKVGEDDWVKVKLTAKPDAQTTKEKGRESAAKIAEQVTDRIDGWAFKVPSFKAERLRRGTKEMLVDKKAGS